MLDRARWLLLTHQGHLVLAAVYSIASIVSVVTYTVDRGPLYGAGQLALTGFGLWWARWCLGRAAASQPTNSQPSA
ncbi:MAG TPA: hypothetical protein VGP92_09870 [Acidimicrobiia bacterium]|nr:hypothetical protein [Acidimicrobiia bacterium]